MTGVRTLIKIGWRGFLRTDVKYGLERKVTLWRHMLGGQPTPFMDAYFNFSSRKQRGPLTDAQVSELEEYQSATVNADYSSRSKEMNVTVDVDPASPSSRKKFVLVLANILKQGNIKRVANIGARASAYLAPRFPEIEFISVDFQPELEMHNSPFPQQPNWRFKIGYPLHLIQRGELRVDLYFCVSTSVLFNNVELNAYLDAIATHAKAIAFCEGWWPRVEGLLPRITRPEEIPKEDPYCSGDFANYHHNYVAKLEERGFDIALSQVVPESPRYHYLQIVGIKEQKHQANRENGGAR